MFPTYHADPSRVTGTSNSSEVTNVPTTNDNSPHRRTTKATVPKYRSPWSAPIHAFSLPSAATIIQKPVKAMGGPLIAQQHAEDKQHEEIEEHVAHHARGETCGATSIATAFAQVVPGEHDAAHKYRDCDAHQQPELRGRDVTRLLRHSPRRSPWSDEHEGNRSTAKRRCFDPQRTVAARPFPRPRSARIRRSEPVPEWRRVVGNAGGPGGEAGLVKTPARSPRVDFVGCAVAPTVAASSVANPQAGQNRAASGRPPPQRRQYIAGFYVIEGSAGMPGSAGVRAVFRTAASIA